MNYKKKYKQDILNELTPNDRYNDIAKKLDFKPQQKENIMKKGLVIASSVICLTLVVGTGAYFLTQGNNNKVLSANGIVKMNLNPSITLMVDEDNIVVSATGENNEGKMILVDEEIEGKTLEEAIEIILTIENETGYLVSGNATIEDNKLSISVTVDDEKIKENIEKRISETVNTVCEQLNVNQTLTYVETTMAELKEELIEYGTYTKQQIENMDFEEVYESLKLDYQEAAVMYSEELIELYNSAKEYEYKIAESDFTINTIKGIDGLQASFLEGVLVVYDAAMDALQTGIDALNDARYDHFVKEDSSYQKAQDKLLEYKAEVIKYRNELAANEEISEEDKANIQGLLDAQLNAFNEVSLSLATIKDSAESALTELEENIVKLMDKVTEAKDYIVSLLSIDIEAELSKKAVELDAYLNETKTNFFNEFETKYADDIEKAKQQLIEYKENLKNQNA